jgi:hypothetical protein
MYESPAVVEGVAVPVLVDVVLTVEVVVVDGTLIGAVPLYWYMLRKLPAPHVSDALPAHGIEQDETLLNLLAAFIELPQ